MSQNALYADLVELIRAFVPRDARLSISVCRHSVTIVEKRTEDAKIAEEDEMEGDAIDADDTASDFSYPASEDDSYLFPTSPEEDIPTAPNTTANGALEESPELRSWRTDPGNMVSRYFEQPTVDDYEISFNIQIREAIGHSLLTNFEEQAITISSEALPLGAP